MSKNNNEVAHLWANKSKSNANKGSHFFFRGDTIYSYGYHFAIARHYKGVVLFTLADYSSSTARHKSLVRSACSHLKVFLVDDPRANPSRQDVKTYRERIDKLSLKAAKARNADSHLEYLQSVVNQANDFCATFGFKTRFTMPDNLDALRERAKLTAQRERKQKAAQIKKLEAECALIIQKWLNGERVTIPMAIDRVYLRVCGDTLETSKGARVPVKEAEIAFRFATKHRLCGWHRNGSAFPVGPYHLDHINEHGIVAGCHIITWDEIDRLAKIQSWK